MKKGGKKYIIYIESNSSVNSNFYLKVVCKHKWKVRDDVALPHFTLFETLLKTPLLGRHGDRQTFICT